MIQLGSRSFQLAYENKNGWNFEAFRDRYSDVLDRYDYIVGDWGYNQLRLKGFFREGNPKSTKDTCITSLQEYIQEYCNFGCAYFVLERIPNKKKTIDQAIGGQEQPKEGQHKHHQHQKEQKEQKEQREQKEQAHKELEPKELHKDPGKEHVKDKDPQPHKERHRDHPKEHQKEHHKDHQKERNARADEAKASKQHHHKDQQKNKRHRGDHKRHERKASNRHPEAARTSQAKTDA